ncbi:MAG: radical SAM protein [Candidatus Hydrogenedentota bacterium]|nr:MAG: radical SAM protein [Candidatus Hydrogenedentota bacterium]
MKESSVKSPRRKSLLPSVRFDLPAHPELRDLVETLRTQFEDDGNPQRPVLSWQGPSPPPPLECFLAICKAHFSMGDYGTTRPEPLFRHFFPFWSLEVKSTRSGPERLWRLEKSLWKVLLERDFQRYFSLPTDFQIELTNRCNLGCVMCHAHDETGSHRPMTRSKEFMDFDLFSRIIEEIRPTEGRTGARCITLQAWGESLMHPRILDCIRLARDAGIESIGLITNGTLIPKKATITDLYESGLTRLQISLDSVKPETYREIRRRDLFRVAEAAAAEAARFHRKKRMRRFLQRLLRSKPDRPFGVTVSFAHQELNDPELDAFVSRWCGEGVEVQVAPVYYDFNYKNIFFKPEIPRDPCIALWKNMMILADGSVSVCCADYDARHKVGDIMADSVAGVWNGDGYWAFRKDHLDGEGAGVDICRVCIGSGSLEKKTGGFCGHPAAFLPHLVYVYRKKSRLERFLRSLLR